MEFEDGSKGMALNLENDNVRCRNFLGMIEKLEKGTQSKELIAIVDAPVGKELLRKSSRWSRQSN